MVRFLYSKEILVKYYMSYPEQQDKHKQLDKVWLDCTFEGNDKTATKSKNARSK